MNGIDVALVVLLLICALRGFWRGFFRESFGFLGVVVGLVLALRLSARVAAGAAAAMPLPEAARLGIAFVALFMVALTVASLAGLLLDRTLGSLMMRRVNQVAGALFAGAKGVAILAFVLLFFHLFPVVPGLDRHLMDSRMAKPMIAAAGSVIRAGLRQAAVPDEAGPA